MIIGRKRTDNFRKFKLKCWISSNCQKLRYRTVFISIWIKKYRENGINGLKSNTGKYSTTNRGKYKRNKTEVKNY